MGVSTTTERARDLRLHATPAERALWRCLRDAQLGYRFRRQHPIPPYFADIACVEAKVVIEIDGGQHSGESDAERDAYLASQGWRVLCIWNSDVLKNGEAVVDQIAQVVRDRVRPWKLGER